MFSFWNHLLGALTVRIHRFFLNFSKQPDAILVYPNLFCGGFSSLTSLKKIEINSIVDLTENQYNKHDSPKFLINYFELPVPDRGVPTLDEVFTAVKWIQDQLENNKKVFVHCNLGRGRGPLLTVLYLIYTGMNKNDAIMKLNNKRSYVFLNHRQQEFIDLFENQLH